MTQTPIIPTHSITQHPTDTQHINIQAFHLCTTLQLCNIQLTHNTLPHRLITYENCCIIATTNPHITHHHIISFPIETITLLQLQMTYDNSTLKVTLQNDVAL